MEFRIPPISRAEAQTHGPPHSYCMAVAVFAGPTAEAAARAWPASLLESAAGVHVFSVVEWGTDSGALGLWLAFDDWAALQQAHGGLVRPFRTDSRGWIGPAVPLSALKLVQ